MSKRAVADTERRCSGCGNRFMVTAGRVIVSRCKACNALSSAKVYRRKRCEKLGIAPDMLDRKPIEAVMYCPLQGVPREDYLDFVGGRFTLREIKAGLTAGIFPPGLVFQDTEKQLGQVWGRGVYGDGRPQELRRFF